jgi:hypothetical protein
MVVGRDASRSWSNLDRLALGTLVAIVLVSTAFLIHPWYQPRPDAAIYISTARSIASGQGITYLASPSVLRPPGLPLLISPLVPVEGPPDFRSLNLLISLFGAAGVVLLFVHQRVRVGWLLALLGSLAIWLNPGYQRLCNQVMSDVPGMALVLLCLLIERWASRAASTGRELLLGVAIGAGAVLRSSVALLVPAILVARLLQQIENRSLPWSSFWWRRAGLLAVTVVVVLLPWSAYESTHAPELPVDQTYLYSRSVGMWHVDPADPGSPRVSIADVLRRPVEHITPILDVLGSRMQVRFQPGELADEPAARSSYVAVSLLLLIGLFSSLWRRRSPMELFALVSLVFSLFYFSFIDRLMLPVYVVAFVGCVDSLRTLLRRKTNERMATAAMGVCLLLLIVADFSPRAGWEQIRSEHAWYAAAMSKVRDALPSGARIASMRGMHYSVHLGRPVFNLHFGIARARSVEAAEAVIDRHDIDTVMLSPAVPMDGAPIAYFRHRYGKPESVGEMLIWRVRD